MSFRNKNGTVLLFHLQLQSLEIMPSGSNMSGLMIGYSSNSLVVKEETLIYPLQSFLAEVGGSLGLFLGFSLIGLWDTVVSIVKFVFSKCVENKTLV